MRIERFDCEMQRMVSSSGGEYVDYKDHIDSHAYDEAKERELFETAYPLDKGVTWVKDMGKTGSYAVRVNSDGGFWACTNAAYQLQIKWEVWSKCAKSRARSAE